MSKPPAAEYIDGNEEWIFERLIDKRVMLVKKKGHSHRVQKVEYLVH